MEATKEGSEMFPYGDALQPDQIRLMKLKQRRPGSILEFELSIHERHTTEYLALSYAWLSHVRSEQAVCNGRRMMITRSLEAALSRIIRRYIDHYLWIDAVCINQDDPMEKSVQVGRMSSTYHDAQAVLVWLGECDADAVRGLKLLDNLCKAFPSRNGDDIRSLYLTDPSVQDPYNLERNGGLDALGIPEDTTSPDWPAAGKLLNASWFERRWILQEVTNAAEFKFLIGEHEITPEVLLGGAYRISYFPEFRHALDQLQRRHCDRILDIVQLLRLKQEPWLHEALSELLFETAAFKSSDPRDRIFAVLGCLKGYTEPDFWNTTRKELVDDHWEERQSSLGSDRILERLNALVDYNKTLPRILTEVALCEPEVNEHILSIFRGLCYVDVLEENVPSWVATWQFSDTRWRSLWLESADPLNDGNYDVTQSNIEIHCDQTVLRTGTIIFDTISEISETMHSTDDLPFASESIEGAQRRYNQAVQRRSEQVAQCRKIAKASLMGTDEQDNLESFLACYAFGAVDIHSDLGQTEDSNDESNEGEQDHGSDQSVTEGKAVDPVAAYRAYMSHAALKFATSAHPRDIVEISTLFNDRLEQLGAPGVLACDWFNDHSSVEKCTENLSAKALSWNEIETELRYGRRFFATENGKIGWAPQTAVAGDVLCVLFGFATPFVLRPVVNTGCNLPTTFRLLGAAYVHETMDGDVFQDETLERSVIDLL